ncbi:MAG: ribosome recycling factor [Eubacteriales bacterium]|nr:ribosome recycling factor [Eubacteriales bacterium]
MGRSHKNLEEKAVKTLAVLKENLNTVRAGRANPALLDKINVDYYGVPTPLKNMTNISVPDPRTLQIVPFDPKTIGDIERAINEANIGINPTNDGKNIRLVMPPLTGDRRKELAKGTKKMGEEAKVAIRNARREADKDAKKLQKDGDISEDELTIELENIQKATDKAVKDIDAMIAEKDKEIMEI